MAKTQQIDSYTIFLVDNDGKMDDTSSIVSKAFSSSNCAFSRPKMICDYIENVPKDHEIPIVITTKGGELYALEKIIKKLKQHPAGYRVYIKEECYSAGAIVALGANKIIMRENSYLGKIDPQISNGLTSKQLVVTANTPEKYISDRNYSEVEEAKNVMNYMREIINIINIPNNIRDNVYEYLINSKLPHFKSFDLNGCKNIIGLNVFSPTEEDELYFKDYDIFNYKYKKMNNVTKITHNYSKEVAIIVFGIIFLYKLFF